MVPSKNRSRTPVLDSQTEKNAQFLLITTRVKPNIPFLLVEGVMFVPRSPTQNTRAQVGPTRFRMPVIIVSDVTGRLSTKIEGNVNESSNTAALSLPPNLRTPAQGTHIQILHVVLLEKTVR